jgi:hypothetical protein
VESAREAYLSAARRNFHLMTFGRRCDSGLEILNRFDLLLEAGRLSARIAGETSKTKRGLRFAPTITQVVVILRAAPFQVKKILELRGLELSSQ